MSNYRTQFAELDYDDERKMFFLIIKEFDFIENNKISNTKIPLKEKGNAINLLVEIYLTLSNYELSFTNKNNPNKTECDICYSELKLCSKFNELFWENHIIPNYFKTVS